GDPETDDYHESFVQPLIVLFEGHDSGWVIEGRDLQVGPSNVFIHGRGESADLAFIRGFPIASKNPQMYEVRVRTYGRDHVWQDAADPYIQWMQTGLRYVPLERQSPSWVKDIRANSW